jgi:hypothetical protein
MIGLSYDHFMYLCVVYTCTKKISNRLIGYFTLGKTSSSRAKMEFSQNQIVPCRTRIESLAQRLA